ncbi:MAG: Ig-like domain-containing protein, partial [Pseudomonadales bacterium]
GSDGGVTNGSDGTGDSGGSGNVSITPPDQDTNGNPDDFTRTSSGIYETERSSTIFNGGVSFVDSAECNGHTGIDVTVTNAATGETVNASERVTCDLIIRVGQWQSGSVALNFGENRITARAETGATASITIVRVANPPTVTSVFPVNNSIDVAVDGTVVRADFSENLSSSSVDSTSFIVEDQTGTTVPGIVRYTLEGQINIPSHATFTPNESLQFGTTYTVRLTTAITDSHGNSLADEFTWSFKTVADILPPNKVAQTPLADSVCAAPDRDVVVQFDKILDMATLTTTTFTVEDSTGTPVDGQVTGRLILDNFIASFSPVTPLDPVTTYTAHLKDGITDLAGNLLSASSWSFSTPYLAEGSWVPIALPTDVTSIWGHTATWTGTELIVWGGIKGDGTSYNNRRYDPALDQWGFVTPVGAPSPRMGHTATWTGTEMIVWGGRGEGASEFYDDGARYDPATDSWTPMSIVDAPTARNGHTAVWAGTELIVWAGGRDQNARTLTGGRYDPSTDTWTPMSTINAPARRYKHHAVFDGQRMIVWGGEVDDGGVPIWVSDGAVYDPVIDVWTPLPTQNAPDITKSTSIPDSVVLADNDMLVWSAWNELLPSPVIGVVETATASDMRRYDTAQEVWVTVVDACDAKATPNAVWLNGRMLSWNDDFTEGYAYDEQRDAWHPITSYPGAPVIDSTVIAIGDSVIVWDAGSFSNVGYRLTL